MGRLHGDNNRSLREKRKDAQIEALKAKVLVEKKKIDVLKARNKELQEKVRGKSK